MTDSKLNFSKKQMIIATCLYLGPMTFGFVGGWTAPINIILKDPEQTPLPEPITDEQASWVGSVLYIGMIMGPYLTSYLSDVVGRRPCVILGGVLVGLSQIILLTTATFNMMLVSRVIVGAGVAIIYCTNLIYVAEIASTNIRGTLLTLCATSSSAGTLLVYFMAPYVSYRQSLYILLGMAAKYILSILLIVPETPVFHLMKGEEQKAISTLKALGRSKEIETFLSTNVKIDTPRREWTTIVTTKSNRKALFITLVLTVLQGGSGATSVIFFATSMFTLAASSIDPNVSTILMGVTLLVSSSISNLFVDKFGRKFLLLLSAAICGVSLLLLATYYFLDNINSPVALKLQWIPIASLGAFLFFYNIGLGAIPGTFIGEMFQSNIRSLGSTLALTVGWLSSLIVAGSFGYMVNALGSHITFGLYSCSCFIALIFTAVFVPETKGKTFDEIQNLLSK